jgi:pilus assembly protein TadC
MRIGFKINKLILRIYPKTYINNYKHNLLFAQKDTKIEDHLGVVTLIALNLFLVCFLIGFFVKPLLFWIFFIIGVVLVGTTYFIDYLMIFFKIIDTTSRLEKSLPDFLHLMASNIRSGLTIYESFRVSARDDFPLLKRELDIVTTNAFGPNNFESSLRRMAMKIKSSIFERIIDLFIIAIKSGPHLAQLLEDAATDISERMELKKYLRSATATYGMFIMFTVVIGAPLLFGISLRFVDIMDTINIPDMGGGADEFDLGLDGGGEKIPGSFILTYSIVMLIITSTLSSVLIGVISDGKKKYGLRYAPFICIASITMLFVFKFGISILF